MERWTWDLLPKAEKALFELIQEMDSPGYKWFTEHGGRAWLHQGMHGFRLGDVFYSAVAGMFNVLAIRGLGAVPYAVEFPVSRITVEDKIIILYDEETKSTVEILPNYFTVDVGGPAGLPLKSTYKQSPWDGHKGA